jgi:hypothetical protein
LSKKVKNIKANKGDILISSDVTVIDHEEGVQAVEEALNERSPS